MGRLESDLGENSNVSHITPSEWNYPDYLGDMKLADFANQPQALRDETQSEWNRNDWFEHADPGQHGIRSAQDTWPSFGRDMSEIDELDQEMGASYPKDYGEEGEGDVYAFDDLDELDGDDWGTDFGDECGGDEFGFDLGQATAPRSFASKMLNG